MQSLRDKLLKAGLVSEEAAKKSETEKAERAKRAEAPRAPRDARPPRSERPAPRYERPAPERASVEREIRVPKLPPLPGSKEAHRLQAKKQVELDRKLREMVTATEVGKEPGATTFHFVTRKNTLRRLELTEAQAKLLETGALAVVERPDPDKIEHALVPAETARAMAKLSAKAVRFLNDPTGTKVGFLSEDEIRARAHEATSGAESEPNDEAPDANDGPAEGEASPETAPDAAADSGAATWVTIKRAPIT